MLRCLLLVSTSPGMAKVKGKWQERQGQAAACNPSQLDQSPCVLRTPMLTGFWAPPGTLSSICLCGEV